MVRGPGVVTGRSGTIGKVHFVAKDYWPHNTALWVTSFLGNDPKFVYYLYTHLDLARFLAGSGVPTLNRNDVHDHHTPLPPLPEQRAIAAVLSDVDKLIGSLEELVAKKRAIKQAAMHELLTGRTRLPGFGGEWKDGRLGQLAELTSGGTPSTSVAAYWSGDIPWITGADILGQTVAKIRRHITEEAVEESPTNVVSKGDLLIVSRTGVGKLAVAPCDIAISQDFTGVAPDPDKLESKFLFRHLDFRQKDLASQNQGTSIKGVTRDVLAETLVPLPSLAEQRAIATVLSDMDDEIAVLERQLAKTRAMKQGMMQELLTGRVRLPLPPPEQPESSEARDA